MFVQQLFIKGIAHSSYLLGGTSTCAIVDPRRDVHIYIDAAEEMGMTITHILETICMQTSSLAISIWQKKRVLVFMSLKKGNVNLNTSHFRMEIPLK